MAARILVLAHGDDVFLQEVQDCLDGLDVEIYAENRCPVESGIDYDWEPVAVIVNTTLLENERCIQHLKTLSRETIVLAAERESTVERYIRMQVLGARDYFHVPLDKTNMKNAIMEILKNQPTKDTK